MENVVQQYIKNEDKSVHIRKEKVARDALCANCWEDPSYGEIFYDENVFLHNINSWITSSSNDPTTALQISEYNV